MQTPGVTTWKQATALLPTRTKEDENTAATRKDTQCIRVTRGCAGVFFLGGGKGKQSQKLNARVNSKENTCLHSEGPPPGGGGERCRPGDRRLLKRLRIPGGVTVLWARNGAPLGRPRRSVGHPSVLESSRSPLVPSHAAREQQAPESKAPQPCHAEVWPR